MAPWAGRTRRNLLRTAATIAGACGTGLALGPGGGGRAALAAAAPGTDLYLVLDWEGLETSYTEVPRVMREVFQPFEAAHPGVRVNAVAGGCSNGNAVPQSQIPAAILAGAGPDVFSLCYDFTPFTENGLVLPLDSYLRRDNVPLQTWPAKTLGAMTFGNHIYFLPAEEQPHVLAMNRALLNQLGLTIPSADWTYTEAAALWRAASGQVGKNRRYGLVSSAWQPGDIHGWTWLMEGFGAAPQNAGYTRSTFNTPEGVAAGTWAVELNRSQVTTGGDLDGNPSLFLTGQAVFIGAPSWAVPLAAQHLRGMDWTFIPYPRFPAGPSTFNQGNAYAISSGTKNPEAAWELLKWIAVEPAYWRAEVRVTLNTPGQTALWPEWVGAVLSIAPDLSTKGMEAYTQAQLGDYGWPGHPFRYGEAQCQSIIGKWSGEAFAGKVTVADAFAQIDRAIDAVQVTGPQVAAAAAKEQAQYHTYVRLAEAAATAVTYPAPPRQGVGTQAVPAGDLVAVAGAQVAYTVTGAGAGVKTANDACMFAAQAYTSSRGQFTCRVVAISAIKAAKIADGAKIGLMARANLASAAASVGLEVAMGKGLHFHVRALDGDTLTDLRPASETAAAGLIGAAGLLQPDTKPAQNYLLKPVWLRLVLDTDTWTPFTSLDGARWVQANPGVGAQFVGAWVGLFVTSNNSGQYIQAVFDHVSGFAPDTFVRIGAP